MKRLTLVTLAVGLLVGCSAKYSTNDVHKNTELLKRNLPVVIAMPADGVYSTQTYAGSGRLTADSIRSAFMKYSDSVKLSMVCEDVVCLKEKNTLAQGYYVVPEITHWEDRATEWSGKPDKIDVKITIYNAELDSLVASTIISGQSKWATFGGDHPQDLLPVPVNSYISSLY